MHHTHCYCIIWGDGALTQHDLAPAHTTRRVSIIGSLSFGLHFVVQWFRVFATRGRGVSHTCKCQVSQGLLVNACLMRRVAARAGEDVSAVWAVVVA